MKSRILNLLLILTSLVGYLEWGKDNSAFLFQAEAEIFSTIFSNPTSVIHPFILLPVGGQGVLLITLFQPKPSKLLTYVGITGIGTLFTFMLLAGLFSLNQNIIASTLPFLFTGSLTVQYHRKR